MSSFKDITKDKKFKEIIRETERLQEIVRAFPEEDIAALKGHIVKCAEAVKNDNESTTEDERQRKGEEFERTEQDKLQATIKDCEYKISMMKNLMKNSLILLSVSRGSDIDEVIEIFRKERDGEYQGKSDEFNRDIKLYVKKDNLPD